MPELTLAIRFPLGSYHAHTAAGDPDWPPHPSRIAAALLNAAHTTGRHIALAERVYTWSVPALWTPPAAARDINVSRWVPVDPPVNIASKRGNPAGAKGITSKIPKPPERGTTIAAPATVWLHHDHTDLAPHDLPALDELLGAVTYLGRPTTPVVIDRLEAFTPPTDVGDLWEPDPDGDVVLRIATPRALQLLDQRHAQRQAVPDPGYQPRMARQDTARYRHTRCGQHTPPVTYPSRGTLLQVAATMTWLPLPGALADDVTTIAALLPDGHALLPAYWQRQDRGLVTDHLAGALVHPALIEPVTVIINQKVTASRPRPVPTTAARTDQLAAACATATAWTTPAPVTADPEVLIAQLQHLAELHGAALVEAQTHDTSRLTGAPATDTNPQLTHASILFDRPVPGPLHLDHTLLLPITAT
ncbi:type I-U CRISPR-associated protein Csb2 [Luteococcus sp.]|uniref:type I-G CRISPR-associated protein Csb2 n=1 Tax=Luteococcus sp. TaxID=1969402 RepID=UPI0037362CDC